MRLLWAAALSFLGGFIALSYEILWFRVYLYASGGKANTFAFLLGAYLVGLAFGSLLSSVFCRDDDNGELSIKALFWFLPVSQATAFMVAPLVSYMVTKVPYGFSYLPAIIAAVLMGVTLPLLSHFGVRLSGKVGQGVSILYLANIAGSTLGSLVTGFWLLEYWRVAEISMALAILGLAMALAVMGLADLGKYRRRAGAVLAITAIVVLVSGAMMFDGFYERLRSKQNYGSGNRFAHTVTNRSGVINVTRDGTLFGGGIYDGKFSTDLEEDLNMIVRAYAIAVIAPEVEEVLVVGLGSGSWVKVIAANPSVKKITVVEINPGYLDVIKEYPAVSGILEDPKIDIVIDDGRRWLRTNPERKFDLIVQNTTFNWRMNVTNLLSVEYLELVKKHLMPGGVSYYNTTGSWRVLATGVAVFPYALKFRNFLAVSDEPIYFSKDRWRQVLLDYEIDGKKVLNLKDAATLKGFEIFLDQTLLRLEDRADILKRTEGLTLVTDDNMGTEWEKK